MSWRTLLIEGDCRPRWRSGALEANGIRVCAADLAGVIVVSPAELSTGALCRLSEYGVPVTFCDHLGRPQAVMYPMPLGKLVATRHRLQADLSLPTRKQVWRHVVQAKIEGQAANIEDPTVAGKLHSLAARVRSGDPENVEGRSAALYWRSMFGDAFRRWNTSNESTYLNYGYTVLRAHVLRSVLAAGLWPTLGIHHQHRSNPACLVDDLIEPLRPMVDYEVRNLLSARSQSVQSDLRRLTEFGSSEIGFCGKNISTVCDEATFAFCRVVDGAPVAQAKFPVWTVA